MKRSFTLNKDEKFYILSDTNPNRNDEPFKIGLEDLKFDTVAFYDYVFKGITKEHEICIENAIAAEDKSGAVVYKTITDITEGVLNKLRES